MPWCKPGTHAAHCSQADCAGCAACAILGAKVACSSTLHDDLDYEACSGWCSEDFYI